MKVAISGQKLNVGEALSSHVEERIKNTTSKLLEHAISAHVTFSKERHLFHCMIELDEGVGKMPMVRASAESDDIYTAFDSGLLRLEKQLRRYKAKMKDYHRRQRAADNEKTAYLAGTKTIISARMEDNPSDDNPVIVAEKLAPVLTMSVGEAVMQMDLQELPTLMFRNVKTGRLNVVYYRADGNISWVDPGEGQ